MKTVTEKNIDELIGLDARLWNFSPSHDRLVFLLKNNDKTEEYLIFIMCDKMHINPFWQITQPKISKGDIMKYKLIDGDIEIHFEECLLHYEYKLT